MTKPTDDFDAVRIVVEALQGFKADEQQRIFRWAAEKLGLPHTFGTVGPAADPTHTASAQQLTASTGGPAAHQHATKDIKSFIEAKNPPNDVQFTATVAYYFRFEAPPSEKKDSITGDDLQEACRKAKRDRLKYPGQTLRNAHNLGLLDKTGEAGHYSINTVGENLVAMTLPSEGNSRKSGKRTKPNAQPKKKTTKKNQTARKPKKA